MCFCEDDVYQVRHPQADRECPRPDGTSEFAAAATPVQDPVLVQLTSTGRSTRASAETGTRCSPDFRGTRPGCPVNLPAVTRPRGLRPANVPESGSGLSHGMSTRRYANAARSADSIPDPPHSAWVASEGDGLGLSVVAWHRRRAALAVAAHAARAGGTCACNVARVKAKPKRGSHEDAQGIEPQRPTDRRAAANDHPHVAAPSRCTNSRRVEGRGRERAPTGGRGCRRHRDRPCRVPAGWSWLFGRPDGARCAGPPRARRGRGPQRDG